MKLTDILPLSDEEHEQWLKERDEAIISCNVATFKKFHHKWAKRGVYRQEELPPNEVIKIALHKMVLALSTATFEQKQAAADWLLDRGYHLDFYQDEEEDE